MSGDAIGSESGGTDSGSWHQRSREQKSLGIGKDWASGLQRGGLWRHGVERM